MTVFRLLPEDAGRTWEAAAVCVPCAARLSLCPGGSGATRMQRAVLRKWASVPVRMVRVTVV